MHGAPAPSSSPLPPVPSVEAALAALGGARVLHLGCGVGAVSFELARAYLIN
jgi:2-polyprenyl-3-methyl-5-hydroxy-6-metoxy-1,4-benzoquinol methylase